MWHRILELEYKDLKSAPITTFKNVKENMLVMNKKIENISKGIETIKLNQM